jgi:hypothetical protein
LKPLASEAAILAAERQLLWLNVAKFTAEWQLASLQNPPDWTFRRWRGSTS